MNKAKPGDPKDDSAETHNAFVDAALAHQASTGNWGGRVALGLPQASEVLVRNDTGSNRGRHDVVGLSRPIIDPRENFAAFAGRLVIGGAVPTAEHGGRFAILLRPLPDGAIGRAVISGPCVVRVLMLSELSRRADVWPGVTMALATNESGSALLSWVQPVDERDNPGIAWTVAIIGSPGTPPARARVWTYSDDYTHYKGLLIDENDEDIDPGGGLIDLWCRKGVPDDEDDIRLYLPRLLATGYAATIWDVRWSVEGGGRWFIDTFFVPWCEAEGVRGTVPDLPFPSPPGEPQVPGDGRALEEQWRP